MGVLEDDFMQVRERENITKGSRGIPLNRKVRTNGKKNQMTSGSFCITLYTEKCLKKAKQVLGEC